MLKSSLLNRILVFCFFVSLAPEAFAGNTQVANRIHERFDSIGTQLTVILDEYSFLKDHFHERVVQKLVEKEGWTKFALRKVSGLARLLPFESPADYYSVVQSHKNYGIFELNERFEALFQTVSLAHEAVELDPSADTFSLAENKLKVLVGIGKAIYTLNHQLKRTIHSLNDELQGSPIGSSEESYFSALIELYDELFQSIYEVDNQLKKFFRGPLAVNLEKEKKLTTEPNIQLVPFSSLQSCSSIEVSPCTDDSQKIRRKSSFIPTRKVKTRGSASNQVQVIAEQVTQVDANEFEWVVDSSDLRGLSRRSMGVFESVLTGSKNIRMKDFENAWESIPNCSIEERAGSSVAFLYRNNRVFLLHRPHPQPVMYPALVKRASNNLVRFGITLKSIEN